MKQQPPLNDKLNRRELLKKAGGGLCFWGLTALAGCFPEENEDAAQEVKEDPSTNNLAKKGLVNPVPSPWYSSLEGDKIRCELCPHLCELADDERALCRVRENRGGEVYSLAHSNPALVQEDPVERKPFYHVVPGSRALSVSTAGCNLQCKFCEVWDMALEDPENVYAYDMPPERVLQYAQEAGLRSISYAFGEPVIFYEYMGEIAEKAREEGFLNLLHTAGYIQPEPLKEILPSVDAVNLDLKGFEEEFYQEVVGGKLQPVLEALTVIKEAGVHLEITNIVIPTLNDESEKIKEMCTWIANELGKEVPLHFARFYPLYQLSDLPRTPVSELEQARKAAFQAGLEYVYVAGVSEHEGENTFCPQCEEKIIKRTGYVVDEVLVEEGKCQHCSQEIPGIWS